MKYEKWSFGYWSLKQYVIFCDWLIHKRVIITGKEKIPENKPIVFAPNHQNALSDPLAVLLHTKFQPVWLARADIFGNKIVAKILRFLKIMPVYRMRDGKENLLKNETTFANSIKVLENNFALALFPEAAHSAKRQMLAHKKAVPRIVFMAEEKTDFNLDIQIIPTGIYYSNYWKFDRSLVVNFGDPIPVKDYFQQYTENQNAATLALREKLHRSILPLTVNIKSKKHYSDIEKITEIYSTHFLKKQNKTNTVLHRFYSDKLLADKLSILEKKNPDELEKIVNQTKAFALKLKKHKIRSWLFEKSKYNFLQIILNKLILLLGLPFFIFGFLFNAIPYFLIDLVIRKKVRDRSFWSTFSLIAGLVVFPLFYFFEFVAINGLIPGTILKIAFLISLPFAGKLAFKWYILLRKTIGRWRLLLLSVFKKQKFNNLLKEKETLYQKLDEIISA